MELAAVLIIAAFIVGFGASWFIEYRQANLKKIEDDIRRALLEDVATEREELKRQINELQVQVQELRRNLSDVQLATHEQVSTLQNSLQEARENALRHEQSLFAEMARNEAMNAEIDALKKENRRLGELLTELREQVALLRDAAHGEE